MTEPMTENTLAIIRGWVNVSRAKKSCKCLPLRRLEELFDELTRCRARIRELEGAAHNCDRHDSGD